MFKTQSIFQLFPGVPWRPWHMLSGGDSSRLWTLTLLCSWVSWQHISLQRWSWLWQHKVATFTPWGRGVCCPPFCSTSSQPPTTKRPLKHLARPWERLRRGAAQHFRLLPWAVQMEYSSSQLACLEPSSHAYPMMDWVGLSRLWAEHSLQADSLKALPVSS